LGSRPTYWINSSANQPATTSHPLPQPHEPLNSPVSPISSSIQISTVPHNSSPYPTIIESSDPLVYSYPSVEHYLVPHIVTHSQTGHSRPHQFPDYVTHYSS
jgi:hypothetical protein